MPEKYICMESLDPKIYFDEHYQEFLDFGRGGEPNQVVFRFRKSLGRAIAKENLVLDERSGGLGGFLRNDSIGQGMSLPQAGAEAALITLSLFESASIEGTTAEKLLEYWATQKYLIDSYIEYGSVRLKEIRGDK